MAESNTNGTQKMWVEHFWKNFQILCQESIQPRVGFNGIFPNTFYIVGSTSTLCLFQISLIMLVICATSFLLKPIGLPIISQLAGGIIIMGFLFPNKGPSPHLLLPDPVLYTLKTISNFGLSLHVFMLGVETNMSVLRRISKKPITICFTGGCCSVLVSIFTYNLLQRFVPGYLQGGAWRIIVLQSQTFFGGTCSNLNYLGISNSELGRLASTISFIMDIFMMFSSFIIFNFTFAILAGNIWLPILIIGDHIFVFFLLRPILIHILSYTPPGHKMSHTHFVGVLFIILLATLGGSIADQKLSVYLFALSIPEEPLSSILAEKLDAITSAFFFPIFCATQGFQANFGYLSDFWGTIVIELIIFSGHFGKFLGTMLTSRLYSVPWESAISLGIIMTSKGFFDIVIAYQWRSMEAISIHEYTVLCLHIVTTSLVLLPLVRVLYEPSKKYSTVFRQNMSHQSGTLQALACIYDDENVPGILHFLEHLQLSRSNPIPMVTIQLIPLTGRCSLPIMAPWGQAKSYAVLQPHISRCDRVVSAFTNIERKFKGYIRLQHYVSVSSYATMHNDICNLAYDKNANLLILPFHVQWSIDGKVINHLSQSIREVNKMVFKKAPCSVATFINRGDHDLVQLQLHLPSNVMFRVTIFFVGGPDDQEALAFSKFFVNHPFMTITLIWLNSGHKTGSDLEDNLFIEKTLEETEKKINFIEVICKDGSETMNYIMNINEEVDLAIVGKNHDPECAPLLGLDGELNEYPEIGGLADFLVTSKFMFSVMVIQQEPQRDGHSNRSI